MDAAKGGKEGYSLLVAVLFVTGESAGVGLLGLSYAMLGTGWGGIPLLLWVGSSAGYCGLLLARCWTILETRWPDEFASGHQRDPYALIGLKAYGPYMYQLVSWSSVVGLIGVSVVLLIACASMINGITDSASSLCVCAWTLILAATLLPLTWLGSPQDFTAAALAAILTTVLSVIFLLWVVALERSSPSFPSEITFPRPSLRGYFIAFGIFIFTFGATPAFPTYQNDMKEKGHFSRAVIIGIIILFIIYIPVASVGYAIYGDLLRPDLFKTVTPEFQKDGRFLVSQLMMAGHVYAAFILTFNPPAQQLETIFSIPDEFGRQRVAFRSGLMLLVTLIGLTLPRFTTLMLLVGGSISTLMVFILPAVLYLKLNEATPLAAWERFLCWKFIVLGAVGGMTCCWFAIASMDRYNSFASPCWLDFKYECKQ